MYISLFFPQVNISIDMLDKIPSFGSSFHATQLFIICWRSTQVCSAQIVLSFACARSSARHFIVQNAKRCAACVADNTVQCLGKHPKDRSLLLSSIKCEYVTCRAEAKQKEIWCKDISKWPSCTMSPCHETSLHVRVHKDCKRMLPSTACLLVVSFYGLRQFWIRMALVVVVVAFSSRARILGECSITHSPPSPFVRINSTL